jgi:hypothetical protein
MKDVIDLLNKDIDNQFERRFEVLEEEALMNCKFKL